MLFSSEEHIIADKETKSSENSGIFNSLSKPNRTIQITITVFTKLKLGTTVFGT